VVSVVEDCMEHWQYLMIFVVDAAYASRRYTAVSTGPVLLVDILNTVNRLHWDLRLCGQVLLNCTPALHCNLRKRCDLHNAPCMEAWPPVSAELHVHFVVLHTGSLLSHFKVVQNTALQLPGLLHFRAFWNLFLFELHLIYKACNIDISLILVDGFQ